MAATNLTSKDVIYKQPREKILVGCNFSSVVGADDSLTGTPLVTATPSGDLALTGVTTSDNIAYVTVLSGVANQDYRMEFEVQTSNSYIYCADGLLKVRSR